MQLAVDVAAGHHEPVRGVGHQVRDFDAAMLRNLVKNPVIMMVILEVILDRPVARETTVHPEKVKRNIGILC